MHSCSKQGAAPCAMFGRTGGVLQLCHQCLVKSSRASELHLEVLRPEMRPSVSEPPWLPALPLGPAMGMPAMILPPPPCSSSLGLHRDTFSGILRAGLQDSAAFPSV